MVNFILRVSPALLGALLLLSPLHASIIEGVDVADSVLVDGKQIPLYRTAVRKAMGFKIYLSAFYLDQKPMSAQAVIDSENPSLLRMHYAYMSIPYKLLVEGIKDYFQKALGKDFGGQETGFSQYMAAYNRPLVKGDVVEVSFAKSRGISFVLSGKTNAVIPGLGFKKALHTAWFGDKSPDPSFRQDLLGF